MAGAEQTSGAALHAVTDGNTSWSASGTASGFLHPRSFMVAISVMGSSSDGSAVPRFWIESWLKRAQAPSRVQQGGPPGATSEASLRSPDQDGQAVLWRARRAALCPVPRPCAITLRRVSLRGTARPPEARSDQSGTGFVV